jgi:hypothetical protein
MSDEIQLSRWLKVPVLMGERQMLGRLVDVTAVLSGATPSLHRLLIGGRGQPRYLVPWSQVESWDASRIRLTPEEGGMAAYRLDGRERLAGIVTSDGEVLLSRDVLDAQVVDLSNRRLARVSEVLMAGAGGALSVTAVDLGVGALLSRLGLDWLGSRMQPTLVAWGDLHLASGRGHSVQLATEPDKLRRLDSEALADLVARLATEPAVGVLRAVGTSRSIDVLDMSHDTHRRRILRAMSTDEADRVVEDAPADLARSLATLRGDLGTSGRRLLRSAGWRVHRPERHRP